MLLASFFYQAQLASFVFYRLSRQIQEKQLNKERGKND